MYKEKGICGMHVLPKYGNLITSITDNQDRSDRSGMKSLSFITMGKIRMFLSWYLYKPPLLLPLYTQTHTQTFCSVSPQ